MSGVELLVAQLVLNGIAKVAMNKLNGSAAIAKSVSATEREVMRMSGVVHGLLSETGGLRDALSSLICSVSLQRASNRRDRMLAAIPDASPLLRSKALQVATMVAAVLEETAVETVGVEVSRVVVDEDDDEYFTKTNKVHFSRVHSDAEIVAAVLALEAADQVFTGLRHETQDRMRLFVNAWAPSEKDLNRLAEATGALYQLCQTLCDVIADSRGVFATSVGDGNISKSYTKLTHNSSTILLKYVVQPATFLPYRPFCSAIPALLTFPPSAFAMSSLCTVTTGQRLPSSTTLARLSRRPVTARRRLRLSCRMP